MSGRLVALSAAAVATIYVTGLLSTQPTAQSAALAAAAPAAVTTSVANSGTYDDGTYTATGTSALGNVTVAVVISGGKISNVQITKVTTKYPVSRIASLPALVVQNQSASVNVVSGATYSSQAFKQAVQLALAQAAG